MALVIFLLGISFIIISFIISLAAMIDRQLICYSLNWHKYKYPPSYGDDYHDQAVFCEHCNKIKWI